MTERVQGPLTVDDGPHPDGRIWILRASGAIVCRVGGGGQTDAEQLVNAKLFVAAPEMHKLLVKLQKRCVILANQCDEDSKSTIGRFPAFSEAVADDAKSYRATAAEIAAVLPK